MWYSSVMPQCSNQRTSERAQQPEKSSFYLFSVQRCGSRIKINFSSKHKLQRFLALLYGLARAIICHVIT